MLFTEIPLEIYGIILNYMKNPLILSGVNKELYNLLNKSVYGRCYYKVFKCNKKWKLLGRSQLPYVIKLNISGDIYYGSEISDNFLKIFVNLQSLQCMFCQKITDKSIIKLRELQTLVCGYCLHITDKSIIKLHELQTLVCEYCQKITDKSIIKFANSKLQILDCGGCQNITDKSIIELASELQELDCSYCQNITDKSIIELKQLQTLTCNNC